MSNIAGIDIGSNAIRLVIAEVDEHGDLRTLKKVREPIRLGQDTFSSGQIHSKTLAKAIDCFKKFSALMDEYGVRFSRAVATSALRDAQNRDEFVRTIDDKTGLQIEVIDGLEEARLIHKAVMNRIEIEDRNALLIDIGGGSVELTLSAFGEIKQTRTFRLGTVRLLNLLQERRLKEQDLRTYLTTSTEYKELKDFVATLLKTTKVDFCIGTGGNFECFGKLRVALLHQSSIFSIHLDELNELIEQLINTSLKDRIESIRLRPDRADVVVPAAIMAQSVMEFSQSGLLLIPYVGLRDGILASLLETRMLSQKV